MPGDGRAPLLIGDLPFGSYLTPEDAMRNSVRLMKEGNVGAVKLEGGRRVVPQVCTDNEIQWLFAHNMVCRPFASVLFGHTIPLILHAKHAKQFDFGTGDDAHPLSLR